MAFLYVIELWYLILPLAEVDPQFSSRRKTQPCLKALSASPQGRGDLASGRVSAAAFNERM